MKIAAQKVKELMFRSPEFVVKSLLTLYGMQTGAEQQGRTTQELNRLGFNKFDADVLSDISQRYYKFRYLTDKQILLIRKKIIKYRKQLASLHNSGTPIASNKEMAKFSKEKWPTGRFKLLYDKSSKTIKIEKGDPKKKEGGLIFKHRPDIGIVTVEGDTFPVRGVLKKYGLDWEGLKKWWYKYVADANSAKKLADKLKKELGDKVPFKIDLLRVPEKVSNELFIVYRNGRVTVRGNTSGLEAFLKEHGFSQSKDKSWLYTEKAFTLFKAKAKIKEFRIALKADPRGKELLIKEDVPK
jgi:hypothetical protein